MARLAYRTGAAVNRWRGAYWRAFVVVLALAGVLGVAGVSTVGPGTGAARAQDQLRIAAVVNDEIISVHDLNQRIDLLLATSNMDRAPQNRQRVAAHVLRLLIEEKLKLQEARRLNVSVSPAELDKAMQQVAAQLGVAPGQIPALLATRAASAQALIDQVQAEITWIKTVQRRSAGRVKVEDEEIEARLDQLEAEAGSPEYRAAEIFLPVEDPAREAEVQALSQRLITQLQEGAQFRTLARNFSQGATAAVGGDLGWLRLEQIDRELQPLVADMVPGQAFGPVRTQSGYHILFMINRRVVEPPERGSIILTLSQLVLPLPADGSSADMQEQMERARSIAASATSCNELIEAADEADAPLSGDLGAVEISELDPALRKLVRPLQIGEKTDPVRTSYGVAVLMVCDRREESVNTELRERIREKLVNERLAIAARRMLRDLQREAFVDIRI